MEPEDEEHARMLALTSMVRHIRHRPANYLGPGSEQDTLHQLIVAALCSAFDDVAREDHLDIAIAVHSSGVVTLRDNGPGLPMEPDSKGQILAELLLTHWAACGDAFRDPIGYFTRAGLSQGPFDGLVIVNALSGWLRIRVFRDGISWVQEYENGVPLYPFRSEGATSDTGMELSFLPDPDLFGVLHFDGLQVAHMLANVGVRFNALEYHRGDPATETPTLLHFQGLRPLKHVK